MVKQIIENGLSASRNKRPHGTSPQEWTNVLMEWELRAPRLYFTLLMYYHIVHFFVGFILDLLLHLKAFENSTEFANEASTLKNEINFKI